MLPQNFKYNRNIFDAIIKVFLVSKENGNIDKIYYRDIYERVKNVLDSGISFRDFDNHIDNMLFEGILNKHDPTGRRGAKVYFSLTDMARKKYNLKILGINGIIQRRKSLYQLLLFFNEFKTSELITETQLDEFLRLIGSSRNDLQEMKRTDAGIIFKPIKGVEIVRWTQSDFTTDSSTVAYYIAVPGFTIEEFILYLKKLKEGKDPRPFSSYRGATYVPFVSYIDYTEDEVVEAIDSLRKKDGSIKVINDVFPSEMRFDIADELRGFIKDVWFVHLIEFRLLDERLAYNGKPTDDERKQLAVLYGEKNVDKFLTLTYPLRKSYKKESNSREQEKTAKDFIKDFEKDRRELFNDIIKKHKKVIEKYEIANELIKEILYLKKL